ncbi:MAG: DUF3078 domain-containing protein [Bacteroidales bacterium]|nr:DUF3078 domain-containing protein [Bacteroidales bacterium]
MRWFRFILQVVLAMCVSAAVAQSVDKNIRDASGIAANAIKSDPGKHPDTVRWKLGGNASLNFSQTWLSNWAAGGEKTLTLNSTANLFANYKKGKFFWENNVALAYGIIKKSSYKSVKNDDKINVGSRIGYQMAKNWYYSAVFLGKTQFSTGYKYTSKDTTRISDFLAPAYFYLSLGLDYKPFPSFSIHFSPIMGKTTLVRSNDGTVLKTSGLSDDLIAKGKHTRYEFGGGTVFHLAGSLLSKKVTYNTQLELFSNYLEEPECIDVIWDFMFRIALTKYVSSGIRINMIYDDNQKTVVKEKDPDTGTIKDVSHGAKLQVKEFFEIGFFYAF